MDATWREVDTSYYDYDKFGEGHAGRRTCRASTNWNRSRRIAIRANFISGNFTYIAVASVSKVTTDRRRGVFTTDRRLRQTGDCVKPVSRTRTR